MSDLDIVTFDWVEKTLVTQVATAENALAAFNREPLDDVKARQKRLLACLFSIQQVTGCLRSLNLTKGALLTAELERALQRLFQDELQGERRLLVLGGVLQGVKLLPAYLAHIREVRRDTGDGLIRCVNDLRRWMGEPARPSCLFFSPALAPGAGVTPGGDRTDEGALRETVATERAAYRRAAQAAMRRESIEDNMATVQHCAAALRDAFRGSAPEAFWYAMEGVAAGVAARAIPRDRGLARLLQAGDRLLAAVAERGWAALDSWDTDHWLHQLLFYLASSKAPPPPVEAIRQAFDVTPEQVTVMYRSLLHLRAVEPALRSALAEVVKCQQFLNQLNPSLLQAGMPELESVAGAHVDAAIERLQVMDHIDLADELGEARARLALIYHARSSNAEEELAAVATHILNVRYTLEAILEHGHRGDAGFAMRLQRGVVESTLHRLEGARQSLQSLLRHRHWLSVTGAPPTTEQERESLALAAQRLVNYPLLDQQDRAPRDHLAKLVAQFERAAGEPDEADWSALYDAVRAIVVVMTPPDGRRITRDACQRIEDAASALEYQDLAREGAILRQCSDWIEATERVRGIQEDEAAFDMALAVIYVRQRLQRWLSDPALSGDDLLSRAEACLQRIAGPPLPVATDASADAAAEGDAASDTPEAAAAVGAAPVTDAPRAATSAADEETAMLDTPPEPDAPPPQDEDAILRQAFLDEAQMLQRDLEGALSRWAETLSVDADLRSAGRRFHSLKGNGRVVDAAVISEVGARGEILVDELLSGVRTATPAAAKNLMALAQSLPPLIEAFGEEREAPDEEARALALIDASFHEDDD